MAHVMHRTTPRRLRRWARALVALGLALVVFANVEARKAVTVQVNGAAVSVFDRSSVDEALERAGVEVRDGALYSAGRNKLLDRSHQPPNLWVNGELAKRSSELRAGDQVLAEDGPDAWERVDTEKVVIPSGLPEVEHRLWNAGQNGMDEVMRGSRSGEVLSSVNKIPMVPAAPEAAPLVALSFDDGPDPRWTVPILENLRREGIKATFCVVGRQARKYPELITMIVADGHVLCDHSETHPSGLQDKPRSEIDLEVGSPSFYLRSLSGVAPGFFRAPGGSVNEQVIRSAKSRNMRMLAWSVDPRDFRGPSPADIQQRVMSEVKPGSVILLHDGGGVRSNTVAALPGLITQLRAAGYNFRTP
jgi:peptidoglycan/xylan/chitin deacetylase (PgdA/CDA1 family)